MWTVNDEILMVQHDQSWDTKEMRKGIHRRRVRRKEKQALHKIYLVSIEEDWCNGNTPASGAGADGSNPSSSA